jgi:hypothetical protein
MKDDEYDPAYEMLVSCLVYTLTLKMESVRSSETSVVFQQTTLGYISQDRTILISITYTY